MARQRCAEADQIASAQFVKRAQQFMLILQPSFMLGNNACAITIGADPERIAPFAAPADIKRAGWHPCLMLVENLAHALNLLTSVAVAGQWAR
jgi:hypothetical protein